MQVRYLTLFIVLWASIHLVNSERCSSRREMVKACPRRCVTNVTQTCFKCNSNCTSTDQTGSLNNVTLCNPFYPSSCGRNQVCLSKGHAGRNICVLRVQEGEECLEIQDGGFALRNLLATIKSSIPCGRGLFCAEDGDRHVCNRKETACIRKKAGKSEVTCDRKGNFTPLQCATSQGKKKCKCVNVNGTDIAGTEKFVNSIEEAPTCINRKCSFLSPLGIKLRVPNLAVFIDTVKCEKCRCSSGQRKECVKLKQRFCNILNTTVRPGRTCHVGKRVVRSGKSFKDNCRQCICINGKLSCLRKTKCYEDKKDGANKNCIACKKERYGPVCGKDGKTYSSACAALNCRGLNTTDYTAGPCQNKNVCRGHQCNDSEVCVASGKITCLSRFGCRRTKLVKQCVNIEKLLCSNDNTTSKTKEVCGSDGKTYPSLCKLLQAHGGQVKPRHKSKCNNDRCRGGQVCGTDGVTYGNICELRFQSANTRVDYLGKCSSVSTDTSLDTRCEVVRDRKKCLDASGCNTLILPKDGCCPMCGGGLTIRFDEDKFESYLEMNPSVETVDDLLLSIVQSDLISKKDLLHCDLQGSLLDNGDLFISLEALNKYESYCLNLAKKITNVINSLSQAGETISASNFTAIPQEFQFALVAQTSSLIVKGHVVGTTTASDGSLSNMKTLYLMGIFSAAVSSVTL